MSLTFTHLISPFLSSLQVLWERAWSLIFVLIGILVPSLTSPWEASLQFQALESGTYWWSSD